MAYSKFTLKDLKVRFGIENKVGKLFDELPAINPSKALFDDLELAKILPVRSEKAKSELIVMPILIELMKMNEQFFTIYSGDSLDADKDKGLQGECDFILAKNTGSFDINTPIITIVEAKKNDIETGIPQCAAQMMGARVYNQAYGNVVDPIYGCVTTADDWVFLRLKGDLLTVDREKYYLGDVPKLLGVFQHVIDYYKSTL